MPLSWEKVKRQRPPVLEAARNWYEKWVRGERPGTDNGFDRQGGPHPEPPVEGANQDSKPLQAYAEPLKIDVVTEVDETVQDVVRRLEALEFSGMAQAETLKTFTERDQALTQQLSELQSSLREAERRLQEMQAGAEGHRVLMESMEVRMLQVSNDLSRQAARIRTALWVAGVGMAAALAAIVVAVMR